MGIYPMAIGQSEHDKYPSCRINHFIINMGMHALFSYRARYDVIDFSNCRTEVRSKAQFFCAVCKRNGVLPCSITEQSTKQQHNKDTNEEGCKNGKLRILYLRML